MTKREESVIYVSGIECRAHSEKFPDGKWRDVYRFTVPGWEECTVTGLRATKRVIRGRLIWLCGTRSGLARKEGTGGETNA